MKLDELLGGSVYIDANVPYMYLRADPIHLPTIRTFLERVVAGEVEAFIGILALDELYYRLLLSRVKETTNRNPLDALRSDLAGAIAAHGNAIDKAIRDLIRLPHMNLVGYIPRGLPREIFLCGSWIPRGLPRG
jgi:predicted nucleic acid-binding protein